MEDVDAGVVLLLLLLLLLLPPSGRKKVIFVVSLGWNPDRGSRVDECDGADGILLDLGVISASQCHLMCMITNRANDATPLSRTYLSCFSPFLAVLSPGHEH